MHEAARCRHPTRRRRGAPGQPGGLKGKVRDAVGGLLRDFARWKDMMPAEGHVVAVATMLDESGYTEMWKQDKSAEAPGRLENLKELVRALADFESWPDSSTTCRWCWKTRNVVTTTRQPDDAARRQGAGIRHVFLPGWEEGIFPNQRSMDESGNRASRRNAASPMWA